jgi:SAM-dependent methyltransferase
LFRARRLFAAGQFGASMDQRHFDQMYQGQAPWDLGRPQPAIVGLAEAGQIHGSVLDVGCGTGEHALYLAARRHECWGVDFVPVAIERAKAKAAQRGINAHFIVGNALELDKLGRQFDTAIDCGLFHTFTDEERAVYVKGLAAVVRSGGLVHILCFSDEEPGTNGPRRVSQQEIRDSFHDGWQVCEIKPARLQAVERPEGPIHSPGGPKAWLATIQRT